MRAAAVLLAMLAVSAAAANDFGYSRLTIERTWTIDSDGSPYDLTAAIGINNSDQRVISITTDPPMDVSIDQDGVIWLHRQSSNETHSVLTAKALVDVDYDTNITSDSPLPAGPLPATPLTEADGPISAEASSLVQDNSSLYTIRNLVNWVHTYVTYDLGYWGKTKSAEQVFADKRGVCVEYTHLLIAMARSLGFDTRYVSGYVYAGTWQPHAWAEIDVPGYGWLPAVATFGQVGILDDTHLAIHYAADQSSTYDVMLTRDRNATISVDDKVSSGFLSSDAKGASVNLTLDPDSYVADVEISSSRPDYVFGSYTFLAPDGYGGEDSSIILLRPYGVVHRYRGLNHSLFQDGYYYKLPIAASFNDAHDEETFGLSGSSAAGGGAQGLPAAPACAPSFLLAALPASAMLVRRRF
jgi:transglutaminase-like putative cysteine protease